MTTHMDAEPAVCQEIPLHGVNRLKPIVADEMLEFGRFRLLLRQRQLLADGMPVELGTRAFDLLLVLLETDGSLVTKDELMSRVWPGIVVAEENLKVQIFALRKALGEDRELIRTEFGPRLPAHCHSSLDRRAAWMSTPDAKAAPVKSKVHCSMDFAAVAARLVCPASSRQTH